MSEKRTDKRVFEITIVMLTNNRADRCLDCVRHAAAALQGIAGEILVINNGQPILDFPAAVEGVPCRIINPGRNLGAGARNLALETTDSEYLLMLDDDAYLEADAASSGGATLNHSKNPVKTLVEIFRSNPRIGAVAFKVLYDNRMEACLLPTVFHGCACGFRTGALKAIGGYPDNFLYYGEEYHVAFHLYQAGYSIVMSEHLRKVRHARDSRGRNTGRIIRLVVRNNISLWISAFPWLTVVSALRDTLLRYCLVARKENAIPGFIKACADLPGTIIRGLRDRKPLAREIFRKVTLIEGVEAACRLIQREHEISNFKEKPSIIICGVGKFPSFWLDAIKRSQKTVVAFWDTNSCWRGRKIRGIPVLVHPEMFENRQMEDGIRGKKKGNNTTVDSRAIKKPPIPTYFLLGASSLPETDFWRGHLLRLGLRPVEADGNQNRANFAQSGTFDLLDPCRVEAFILPFATRSPIQADTIS